MFNINPLLLAVIAFIASILSVATTSVGLRNTPESSKSDRTFLTINMVTSVLLLVLCLVYFGYRYMMRTTMPLKFL